MSEFYYPKKEKFKEPLIKNMCEYEELVEKFVKKELDDYNIPKPPREIKLVKDEFETQKEFEARVKKAKAKQKN